VSSFPLLLPPPAATSPAPPFVVGMLLVGARARAYFFSLLSLMRRFVANFCVCREASGDEGMLSASLTLASSYSHDFFSFFGAGLVLVWLFFLPSVCITSVCVLFPLLFFVSLHVLRLLLEIFQRRARKDRRI